MNNRKIIARIIGDEVSETYVAGTEDEKMEIYYDYDRVKNVNRISIWWEYSSDVPRSMVEIIGQEIAGGRSAAKREAKKILRSKIFEKLDSGRIFFSFDEEASILMRFLHETRSFEELVAVVIGAHIAKESREKRLEKALLDGDPASPYRYDYYRYYFKNYLLDVSRRYSAKYFEGLFQKIEDEEKENLLKLSSRSRKLTKIITIPYQDGWINLKIMRMESRTRNRKEVTIDVSLSPSAETIYTSPEDERHLISTFSSLTSLREAETLTRMLSLIAWLHNNESWNRHQQHLPMKIFDEDPQNTIKRIIEKYVDLLEKYPNHLEEIPFYQEYPEKLTANIKNEIRDWKNVANFISKHGSRKDLQKYIQTAASLAIRIKDLKTLKEILPHLPQNHRNLIKDKLIIDSITQKKKVYTV